MVIGLHDSDKTGFPNLALMRYDRVYSSKVFTFTPEEPLLPPDTIKGGTGYGIYEDLPEEIDAMFPDYSIYPDCKHATRPRVRPRMQPLRGCFYRARPFARPLSRAGTVIGNFPLCGRFAPKTWLVF